MPPNIVGCPFNGIQEFIELGLPGSLVFYTEPTATDISGIAVIANQTHIPGDFFPVGMTVVTYTFTDNSMNTAVCSFTVLVITSMLLNLFIYFSIYL